MEWLGLLLESWINFSEFGLPMDETESSQNLCIEPVFFLIFIKIIVKRRPTWLHYKELKFEAIKCVCCINLALLSLFLSLSLSLFFLS